MVVWVPRKRMMAFIDGSNFIGQMEKERNLPCRPAGNPHAAHFKIAKEIIHALANRGLPPMEIIRAYWFGSYKGSDEVFNNHCETLRFSSFEPVLFRLRNNREKGVDIALTKEMLVNAFHKNFEVALLMAGDEDYAGLVKELKRYGASIQGVFFKTGLSPHLRLEFDHFYSISDLWNEPSLGRILSNLELELKAPSS